MTNSMVVLNQGEQTKLIIFSGGKSEELTYEETREHFYPMLFKSMKTMNNKFVYNKVEEEDFLQILEIELWNTYEKYDPETGYCFSTLLYHQLRKGTRDATYSKFSTKNQHNGICSLDTPLNDTGLLVQDFVESDADTSESLDFKLLLEIIKDNLNEAEKELFKIVVDVKNYSVQNYADKHNITRQAANQRVLKLKEKLRKVVSKNYLEII